MPATRPKGSPKTPGSGRRKGTPNKRRKRMYDAMAACERANVCPFEYMADTIADEDADRGDRTQCAKELAKYMRPQLKAIEVSGAQDKPVEITFGWKK